MDKQQQSQQQQHFVFERGSHNTKSEFPIYPLLPRGHAPSEGDPLALLRNKTAKVTQNHSQVPVGCGMPVKLLSESDASMISGRLRLLRTGQPAPSRISDASNQGISGSDMWLCWSPPRALNSFVHDTTSTDTSSILTVITTNRQIQTPSIQSSNKTSCPVAPSKVKPTSEPSGRDIISSNNNAAVPTPSKLHHLAMCGNLGTVLVDLKSSDWEQQCSALEHMRTLLEHTEKPLVVEELVMAVMIVVPLVGNLRSCIAKQALLTLECAWQTHGPVVGFELVNGLRAVVRKASDVRAAFLAADAESAALSMVRNSDPGKVIDALAHLVINERHPGMRTVVARLLLHHFGQANFLKPLLKKSNSVAGAVNERTKGGGQPQVVVDVSCIALALNALEVLIDEPKLQTRQLATKLLNVLASQAGGPSEFATLCEIANTKKSDKLIELVGKEKGKTTTNANDADASGGKRNSKAMSALAIGNFAPPKKKEKQPRETASRVQRKV
eukprot:c14977_g1_i1.p1 GENE.c14977_g1_i1~~c14977_g1_i1.p1  ORF type:complete len:499 (-),score=92.72 c14977_g1_i1:79-1575(-)